MPSFQDHERIRQNQLRWKIHEIINKSSSDLQYQRDENLYKIEKSKINELQRLLDESSGFTKARLKIELKHILNENKKKRKTYREEKKRETLRLRQEKKAEREKKKRLKQKKKEKERMSK
eukprot:437502_1